MTTIKICDRKQCSKQIEKAPFRLRLDEVYSGKFDKTIRADLCDSCGSKIKKWLEARE